MSVLQPVEATPALTVGPRKKVTVDQSDMFTHVFSVFEEHKVNVRHVTVNIITVLVV